MATLISGSLAFDVIMDFPGKFKDHILPDKIHMLNVAFQVDTLERQFGGCSGNIAYTMKLLGGDPIILAPLGRDGGDYIEHFKSVGINTSYIPIRLDGFTSSAHMITDRDHNQIIAFHTGAGDQASMQSVSDVREPIELALLTPAHKDATIRHARECKAGKIPFVFDPSHQLGTFSKEELIELIDMADFYIGNDYELALTLEKTGWTEAELAKHAGTLIVTLGEKGSKITAPSGVFEIPICPVEKVVDPTGAGDAYRAGFFTAYTLGHDLETCGRVGAVAATYAIEQYGTQRHHFSLANFKARYKQAHQSDLSL